MYSSSGCGVWRYLAMTTRYPLSHSLTAVYRSNEYGALKRMTRSTEEKMLKAASLPTVAI